MATLFRHKIVPHLALAAPTCPPLLTQNPPANGPTAGSPTERSD